MDATTAPLGNDPVEELRAEIGALRRELHDLREARVGTFERVNIVEPDGTLRLVISSRERFPQEVQFAGRRVQHPRPYTGMLFFNDDGDECGGLGFGGARLPDGQWIQTASLTFDRFHQDQVLQLIQEDDNGQQRVGLTIFDRPDTASASAEQELARIAELHGGAIDSPQAIEQLVEAGLIGGSKRLFLGRTADGAVTLALNDAQGHRRFEVTVAENGDAALSLYDADGSVIWSTRPGPEPDR